MPILNIPEGEEKKKLFASWLPEPLTVAATIEKSLTLSNVAVVARHGFNFERLWNVSLFGQSLILTGHARS